MSAEALPRINRLEWVITRGEEGTWLVWDIRGSGNEMMLGLAGAPGCFCWRHAEHSSVCDTPPDADTVLRWWRENPPRY
jgi:hypothetical protein